MQTGCGTYTSSLGDPGGVVGLATVLSPTVAVTVEGDLKGDFVLGGDFIGVLSFSLMPLLSSLGGICPSGLSRCSKDLSEPLSSVPLSGGPKSGGPPSALLSLLTGLSRLRSRALSALSGTLSEGVFSGSLSTLSESLSGALLSTITGGLSALGSSRGS